MGTESFVNSHFTIFDQNVLIFQQQQKRKQKYLLFCFLVWKLFWKLFGLLSSPHSQLVKNTINFKFWGLHGPGAQKRTNNGWLHNKAMKSSDFSEVILISRCFSSDFARISSEIIIHERGPLSMGNEESCEPHYDSDSSQQKRTPRDLWSHLLHDVEVGSQITRRLFLWWLLSLSKIVLFLDSLSFFRPNGIFSRCLKNIWSKLENIFKNSEEKKMKNIFPEKIPRFAKHKNNYVFGTLDFFSSTKEFFQWDCFCCCCWKKLTFFQKQNKIPTGTNSFVLEKIERSKNIVIFVLGKGFFFWKNAFS